MIKKFFAVITIVCLFIVLIIIIRVDISKEKRDLARKEANYKASIIIDKNKKGVFIPTHNMNKKRYSHTSILLKDGKVLIIGGDSNNSFFADNSITAEFYDFKTQKFINMCTLTLKQPQYFDKFKAILLADGKVVILNSSDIEIFDPLKNMFYSAGHLRIKRFNYAASLLPDGKILIAGGRTFESNKGGYGIASSDAEIYDPKTGSSVITNSLIKPRFDCTAISLKNGKVIILGGQNLEYKVNEIEIYDPKTGVFSLGGKMLAKRNNFTATLMPDDNILIIGGLNSVAKYNPKTKKLTFSDGLDTEMYDSKRNIFIKSAKTNIIRSANTATLLPNGKILIIGGERNKEINTAEIYDPKINKFILTGSMHYKVSYEEATLLPNGKVLVTGGINYNNLDHGGYRKDSNKAELYIPE